MAKTKQKNLKVRLSVIGLIIAVCLFLLLIPFMSIRSDESKFDSLSTNMKTVLNDLQSADTSSTWRYTEECIDGSIDDLPSGDIVCISETKLQRIVSTSSKAKDLHELYYNEIKNNPKFSITEDISVVPDTFGEIFVVSVIEQQFKVNDLEEIMCRYGYNLGQLENESEKSAIGSPIKTSKATVSVSMSCSGPAQNYWY